MRALVIHRRHEISENRSVEYSSFLLRVVHGCDTKRLVTLGGDCTDISVKKTKVNAKDIRGNWRNFQQ